MARALSLCSAATLALWHGAAFGAAAPAGRTIHVRAVIVLATGKGGEPHFDQRIPESFRSMLKQFRLNYSRYELVGAPTRATPLGRAVLFPLADRQARSLRVQASQHEGSASILRVDAQILPRDRTKDVIFRSQWRISYGRIFVLHYARSPTAALLMGVSVHKRPQ